MKNLRLIFAIGMMAVSTAVFAQSDVERYNRFEVSYNHIRIDDDLSLMNIMDAYDKMNGFSGGYIHGFRLFESSPLFFETGFRLSYAYGENDLKDDEKKVGEEQIQTFAVVVPVNLAYQFSDNGDFSLTPFAGITIKGNILAEYDAEIGGDKYHVDLFNSIDDEEDAGVSARHFQFGWNCGLNVNYKNYSLGLTYSSDITRLAKNIKSYSYSVSVGYTF